MLYMWIRTGTILLYLHARVMESSSSVKILSFKLRVGDLGLLLKQNRNTRKILSHPNSNYKVEQNIQKPPSQYSGIGQNCTKEQKNVYSWKLLSAIWAHYKPGALPRAAAVTPSTLRPVVWQEKAKKDRNVAVPTKNTFDLVKLC